MHLRKQVLIDAEMGRWGDGEMGRHGDMETRRHGDTEMGEK